MNRYVILFTLIFFFTACQEKPKEDINIGFVVGLTGKYSALGTDIRDGFILAFDEIEHKINNQKIHILQKDDKQDPKEALKSIKFLKQKGVKLVVGNATSSMTKISIPFIETQKEMLLISPTASSSEFAEIDDNFLRIQVENAPKRYKGLSKYLLAQGYKNVFMIYDSKNKIYVKDYENMFQDMFISIGGNKFVGKIDLSSSFNEIVSKIKSLENDLILIVGNSIDSAKIIQYLRLNKVDTKILCSGWAKTLDFIDNGGKAVNGVIFNTGYDDNSQDKNFVNFVKKYESKYNNSPSVFAAQGYELASILIEELQKSSDISTLKQRILKTKRYNGLQGDIIFDKYGDVSREYFLMEVKEGMFIKME